MISQKCPKCQSQRIRRGYRPTGVFSKLFFRFNLLCDNCNWEFIGFALPIGSAKNKNYRRKKEAYQDNEAQISQPANESSHLSNSEAQKPRIKKKVKIRI